MWNCKHKLFCLYKLTLSYVALSGEAGGGGPTCTGKEPYTAAGLPTPTPWRRPRAVSGRATRLHHSIPLTLSCPGEREERGWPCQCGSRGRANCEDTAKCPVERFCSATPARRKMRRDARCRCIVKPCSIHHQGVWSAWLTPWPPQSRNRLWHPPCLWTHPWMPLSLMMYLNHPRQRCCQSRWIQLIHLSMNLCLWPYQSHLNQRAEDWALLTKLRSVEAPDWTVNVSTGLWRSSDLQITLTHLLLQSEVTLTSGAGRLPATVTIRMGPEIKGRLLGAKDSQQVVLSLGTNREILGEQRRKQQSLKAKRERCPSKKAAGAIYRQDLCQFETNVEGDTNYLEEKKNYICLRCVLYFTFLCISQKSVSKRLPCSL